jgi:hypothetical protein
MVKRKKTDKKKRPIAVTVIAVAMVILFLIRLYQVYEPLFLNNIFRNGIMGPLFTGWELTALGSVVLSSATYLFPASPSLELGAPHGLDGGIAGNLFGGLFLLSS